MSEMDDLYGDQADEDIKPDISGTQMHVDSVKNDNEASSESEESDSDVEFVISTKPGQRAEPPSAKAQPYAAIKIQKPGSSTTQTMAPVKKEPVAKLPDVDVDAIAELDGKSILEVDLESLENKPWRQPGADITEYFNYGFDEFTWTAYCQKQTTLRSDYAPSKVMQGMMGAMDPTMMGGMGAGLMMPPMDPNMMQQMGQMYGQMPMDFMPPPVVSQNAFQGQMSGQPPPQFNQYNRQGPSGANSNSRADNASPLPQSNTHNDRSDSAGPMGNVPRGPAQSRGAFRNKGTGGRW